jgi:hypothetical protein
MADEHVFQIVETPIIFQMVEEALALAVQDSAAVFNIEEQAIAFPILEEQIVFNVASDLITFELDGIGVPGPQGPPGLAEEDVVYAKRVDFITDSLLYKGEAEVGALTSAAVWRVRRLTIGSDNDVTEEWANGNADFDKVWDNRAGFSYT